MNASRSSMLWSLGLLATVLIIGLPLFLRSPVWVDVTYHDLSAWNVLHGGVHYRDVFETNLPGMVWLHCLTRSLLGWSHEAIRIVDFLVLTAIIAIFCKLFPNLTGTRRIGFAIATYLFYLFETEFIHCQRDGWMLLPCTAALYFRWHNIQDPSRWRSTVAEGFLWGFAIWIKPHVFVIALSVWIVSLGMNLETTVSNKNRIRRTLGLLIGGLIAGIAGCVWLIASGTWKPMWDVLLNWNGDYYDWSWKFLAFKVRRLTMYFAPFSLLHFVAIPISAWILLRLRKYRDCRPLIAAMYLSWLAQAVLIQKNFDYAHSPTIILGLAVLASQRLPVGPVFLIWCLLSGLWVEIAGNWQPFLDLQESRSGFTAMVIPHHPIANSSRLRNWTRSWTDSGWELKDELSYFQNIHCVPNWTELNQVKEKLKELSLRDGELLCWHDTTHPLYRDLNIRLSFRYPHVITAMRFRKKIDQIQAEAFNCGAKYIVSDLVALRTIESIDFSIPAHAVNQLPEDFPDSLRDVYPWNQPVIYRVGRYLIHRVDQPRGTIDFKLPE